MRHRTRTIVVPAGTTLSNIAERHGVTVGQLMRLNALGSSRVRAGQRIKIPIS